MAVPRVFSQSRSLLARGFAARIATGVATQSAKPAFSQRLFTSSARLSQEMSTSATSTGASSRTGSTTATGPNANSIAVFKIPRRASKKEIEEFIGSLGFDIKRIGLYLDRFSFQNNSRCILELASPEQAQEAIKTLENQKFQGSKLVTLPLRADYVWDMPLSTKEGLSKPLFFPQNEAETKEAIRPLLEGRRMMFQVMQPGFPDAREAITRHLGSFGLEAVSRIAPFLGHKKREPRLLCFVDFLTKEGADKAVEAVHGKTLDGVLAHLEPSVMAPWRAHQISKVDPSLLKQLQAAGVASQKPEADKFSKPWPADKQKFFEPAN